MEFKFSINDDPPPSGWDIGELRIVDASTGRASESLPWGRCYMVYVETAGLLNQLRSARINRSVGRYSLSSDSSVEFNGKNDKAVFHFSGLVVRQSLDDSIEDLSNAVRAELVRIEPFLQEEDSGIASLRMEIDRSS